MPERFVLGKPERRDKVMTPNERAVRALVVAMNRRIHVEITPQLVAGLASLVAAWPDARSGPSGLGQPDVDVPVD
jgi:hypothetical protein